MTSISVVVPVYNGGERFRRCLEALAASSYAPLELLVVDDGSSDGSDRLAVTFGARVIYSPKTKSGPAFARNLGATAAQGDVLFFTDPDCVVHEDSLAQVAAIFSIPDAPDAAIGSYDLNPGAPNFLSQFKNLLHAYVHQHGREKASTFWGACGAIRRETFRVLGGFDALRYPLPSIEDIDLGYRLRAQGGRILLCKSLQVTHLKRWTLRTWIMTDVFYRGIPWTRLLLRHHNQFDGDLNLGLSTKISVVLVYLGLLSIVLLPFEHSALPFVLTIAVLLLILNHDVYRYFAALRGPWFAVQSVACHWLYFGCSGISFIMGVAMHLYETKLSRSSMSGR